ncbi:MAG: TetR/AcrR family transcriptional regulator [Desulfobacteraceae bacterium]
MRSIQRRRQSEGESRVLILDAATGLFAEKGYAATKVQEIVDRAGVTKPVLYYYFRNKEGLFQAIWDRAERLQEQVLDEVSAAPGTAMDRFELFCERVYEKLAEYPDLFRFIHHVAMAQPSGTPRRDIKGPRRKAVEVLSGICREGVKRGELEGGTPADMAMMVLAIIDFCIHHDFLYPESADRERPVRMLRLAFEGLKPAKGGSIRSRIPKPRGMETEATNSYSGKNKR